jgi:hypothetical protein
LKADSWVLCERCSQTRARDAVRGHAGFAYLHLRGARNLNELPHLLEYIARTRIPGRPHVEFAIVFLLMNSAMFMFVALGCLIAFVATV